MLFSDRLRYDHGFMWDDAAAHGAPADGRDAMFRALKDVRDNVMLSHPGFWAIPDMYAEADVARALAAKVAKKFSTLVVVGIGGSDLGARTLVSALQRPGKGMRLVYLGSNTDPAEIADVTRDIDWRKTAINVVSKSGDTVEPMSTFLILREMLIKKVGVEKHSAHVVATTDMSRGALREIAVREGYAMLAVPEGIGGRFSALTAVGFFPAACAGVDVRGLLTGAEEARAAYMEDEPEHNASLLFAVLQCDAAKRGMRIDVLMPYAASLKDFAFWFRQLWAESLGKRTDKHGREVRAGMTPVAALGATDQHSQIQLYNDGPADKTVTFIDVASYGADYRVPKPYLDIPVVAAMGGHKMSAIIRAEREATARSLALSGTPNGTIHIDKVDAKTLGALMMFFMLATASAAELLGVDAYDQPGVESGKKILRDLLAKK